jgi:AbrB family looped-hinge helix DNA binding protein
MAVNVFIDFPSLEDWCALATIFDLSALCPRFLVFLLVFAFQRYSFGRRFTLYLKRKVRKYLVSEVKISSKNQIVVPREARSALKLKPGDRLLAVVRGDTLILMAKPKKHSKAIRGMGKGLYPEDYLKKERESWT